VEVSIKTFLIQTTIFDRKHLLTIHPDFISFDDDALNPQAPATFSKTDIESIRYAIDSIRGRVFRIGRTYRIELRSSAGKIIRIRLRSIYGIRKKNLGKKYGDILRSLHQAYFNEMAAHYIRLLRNEISFTLAGLILTPDGVDDAKLGTLPWLFVGMKSYFTYFAIYDMRDAGKYRSFDYGMDWNAAVLRAVVDFTLRKRVEQMKM
jgi:hypothetical protein